MTQTKKQHSKKGKTFLLISSYLILIAGIVILVFMLLKKQPNPNPNPTPYTPVPMENITWTNDTYTYDGNPHQPQVSGYPTDSEITYIGGDENNNGTGTNAGEYTITALIVAPGFDPWMGQHELTINKATISNITWSQDTFTYNGSAKSLQVIGVPTGTTINYSGNSKTNVGEYTVSASITGSNYNTWTGTHNLIINPANFPSFSWTTDTFIFDETSHSLSLQGLPANSTVTYSGGPQDNGQGATQAGEYTISATVSNPNYTTATTSHTLKIVIPTTQSYIKLQDDSVYYINTSYNNFTCNRTTSDTFAFHDYNQNDYSIAKANIKEIHLIDLPQITIAPNNYFLNMCYGMTNLTVADIQLPQTITSCNGYAFSAMFQNCTSLTSLPSGFNIPQSITKVGSYFCQNMFRGCSNLNSLPTGFNIPSITSVLNDGVNFLCDLFRDCVSLTTLPSGFTLPQNITSLSGNYYCSEMFYGCTNLNILPDSFNLSSSLTTVGSNFCQDMFYNCSALTTLPAGFNLPQNLTYLPNFFCAEMFESCTSLNNDNTTNLMTIHISDAQAGNNPCIRMFKNCTNLLAAGVPLTPSLGSDIQINAN